MDTLSCVRNEREFGGLMWRWNAVMLMPGSVLIADPGSVAIAFSAPQAARGSLRYLTNTSMYIYMVNGLGWTAESINFCAKP